ncbi:MAG TPA: SBBP repeat-containing protein [Candidatus Udaeobacter sp.]
MFALIYLGLAITLGDLLCRRFYRFVSIPHRCAAATLVGILLSTWFTYLVGLAFAHTSEPLLFSELLFFVIAPGAIFWLSRKAPKVSMLAPRAPGSAKWDWIALGALFAAACILLVGTLYVNKQGQLRVAAAEIGDSASQLSIAQTLGLGQRFPIELPQTLAHRARYQFLFYFQAGNLEFLGLNLAWSVDLLSVLGLTSTLALVMALGELLFNSRVVGRLGATLFFFHGYLQRVTSFLAAGYAHRHETWGFWKQIAFVDQRHVPFGTGLFLIVLIFLVDQYRRRSATGPSPDGNVALGEPKQATSQNRLKTGFRSTIITNARPALGSAKGFVFSGLLLVALPLWNALMCIAAAVVLCCLFVAYGCWRLWRLKTPAMLGQALGGTLTACILAAGVMDFLAVYNSPRLDVKYDTDSLVHGLVFRRSVIYKIPDSVRPGVAPEGAPKLPVTAFEGGHGNGKGQFDNPRALAVDSAGNIFVADTNNGRIEKFSRNGTFVTSIATTDPNGIAIDRAGNIYVAEIGSKHRVQKLGPEGTFIAAWSPGLYGPRKIAIAPDDSIYVVDSGRNRIVKFSFDGHVLSSLGSEGRGDGQFRGVSSVAVDPSSNRVYVADPVNSRVQVFDSNGKFLTKWSVPEWGQPLGCEDLAIDSQTGRLYASSMHMNSVLIFDLKGTRLGNLVPSPPDKLEGPSGLALFGSKLYVLCVTSSRVVRTNL